MSTALLIALVASGVSLSFSVLIYLQHRRAGTRLPRYEVGATLGSIGLPLLVAGASALFEESVSIALVSGGSLLAMLGALLVSRAWRQMRAGDR